MGPVGTVIPIKKAKADVYTTMPSATATRQVAYQVTPKALSDKNKDGTTELAGVITARNLSIEVVDYSNIPTQSYIEIGNEVMYVKSKTSPNKLSVRRAQNGTTVAASSGTPVDLIDATDDALLTSGDDFGFRRLLLIMNDGLDKAFDIVETIDDVAPKPEVKKPRRRWMEKIKYRMIMNMPDQIFTYWWIKDKLSTVLLIWLI